MRPEGFYNKIAGSGFAKEARESPAFVEFIADAMLEGLKKWGNEPCYEHLSVMGGLPVKRHNCMVCWQALTEDDDVTKIH